MSEDASISLPFADRHEAGRILASRLTGYAHKPDVTVLGLARGGVPVGFEIAKTLALRFDVFVVRKLGLPGHEELAMGAIASSGIRVLNSNVLNQLSNAEKSLREATAKEEKDVCASTPNPFYAVGQFYRDFSQTTDDEVRELMMQAEPTP